MFDLIYDGPPLVWELGTVEFTVPGDRLVQVGGDGPPLFQSWGGPVPPGPLGSYASGIWDH